MQEFIITNTCATCWHLLNTQIDVEIKENMIIILYFQPVNHSIDSILENKHIINLLLGLSILGYKNFK